MNIWEWITTTTTIDNVFTTLGLGALAVLFATDRIITKAQHLRRVADLEAHHARELAEKDSRLTTVDESRKEWKSSASAERDRADIAVDTMREQATAIVGMKHVLESLDEVFRETKRNDQ